MHRVVLSSLDTLPVGFGGQLCRTPERRSCSIPTVACVGRGGVSVVL